MNQVKRERRSILLQESSPHEVQHPNLQYLGFAKEARRAISTQNSRRQDRPCTKRISVALPMSATPAQLVLIMGIPTGGGLWHFFSCPRQSAENGDFSKTNLKCRRKPRQPVPDRGRRRRVGRGTPPAGTRRRRSRLVPFFGQAGLEQPHKACQRRLVHRAHRLPERDMMLSYIHTYISTTTVRVSSQDACSRCLLDPLSSLLPNNASILSRWYWGGQQRRPHRVPAWLPRGRTASSPPWRSPGRRLAACPAPAMPLPTSPVKPGVSDHQ